MTYTVAVRELCEFTAKQGDLDLRFTPAPSALDGMAGHALVQGRRGAGYETEVGPNGWCGPPDRGSCIGPCRAEGEPPARWPPGSNGVIWLGMPFPSPPTPS